MTKVRIPKDHFNFFRKLYLHYHETLQVEDTEDSFLDLSRELLGNYLKPHLVPQAGDDLKKVQESKLEWDDQPESDTKTKVKAKAKAKAKAEAKAKVKAEVNEKDNISPNLPLLALHNQIYTCNRCFLGERRKQPVKISGSPRVPIMVVSDLPSFYDETQGRYFTDEPGKLLIKVVESLGVAFKDVYHTAVIKCASAIEIGNQLDKLEPCRSYLLDELNLIKPQLIIAFGEDVFHYLKRQLQEENPYLDCSDFLQIKGKVVKLRGIELVITHHPRELVLNSALKKQVWDDLKDYKDRVSLIVKDLK